MSRETLQHLNTQTLIGFTEKRGNAWHYRAELQGDESNHYPGPIPIEHVSRRLFFWQAMGCQAYVKLPATIEDATGMEDDGTLYKLVAVPGQTFTARSDNGHVMGGSKGDGYEIHQFEEWLLQTVATLLDGELAIGSAGTLRQGSVAWVSVEIPDTITTPEGVRFRPNLLACTSHDSSLATTFQRVITNTVCDNTMSAALAENGERIKIRHSRYSKLRIGQARDALNLIHSAAEDFEAQVKALCAQEVSAREWAKFVDAYTKFDQVGPGSSGRSITMASNKRDGLHQLWNHDERVQPWAGTAWGVVQAVNTFVHHKGIIRGTSRAERNMSRAVGLTDGGVDTLDRGTLDLLNKVLVAA